MRASTLFINAVCALDSDMRRGKLLDQRMPRNESENYAAGWQGITLDFILGCKHHSLDPRCLLSFYQCHVRVRLRHAAGQTLQLEDAIK